jgi:hypothetical protein
MKTCPQVCSGGRSSASLRKPSCWGSVSYSRCKAAVGDHPELIHARIVGVEDSFAGVSWRSGEAKASGRCAPVRNEPPRLVPGTGKRWDGIWWCAHLQVREWEEGSAPGRNRAAGARFCALGTKSRWEGVQGSRIWWETVSDGAGGARVDGFARGRRGHSPQGKSSHRGSIFDWGRLSPTGMGLGSPK